MSSNQTAIKVEKLSKCYYIYNQPQDRLKQSIYPRLQRLAGRPLKTYFHEFWALRDVSFEVRKGETIGIIGRNGSGKSTLLQLICGTLTPTGGTIQTRGRIAALLELGSGFNPEFTGRENVYLNGAILGLTREEVDARFDNILAFADIGDFIEQPVKTYSSGMVVRLAFSVQATIDPDILIVDEALAVGDEKFQRKCFARLEELKNKGTAILFVSHTASQILELCDGALLLEQGLRLMYAKPADVVHAYHKLIYAPPEQQTMLTQEYRIADQSGDNAASLELPEVATEPNNNQTTGQPSAGITNIGPIQPQTSASDGNKKDYFDPGLVPETTEVYPVQGAEILSFQILNMDGHPVNVLSPGQEYSFETSGKFLSNRAGIYFGIHIRSISGLVITGQVYPETGKHIEQVQDGQSFRITYGFKISLLPGVYFVGGGIWSIYEPNCLHRIVDALMFRVSPHQMPNSFGYVDVSSRRPHLVIA
jgi:lipopolysaccharide transport system ATP-binding protein